MRPRSPKTGRVRPSNSRRGPKTARLIGAPRQAQAELARVLDRFVRTRSAALDEAAAAVAAAIRAGGKVLVFGNGGSAAEAQHFAAELVNGLSRKDGRALPAVALASDTAALTAIGNDRGFVHVFGRQIEALGRPGDVAVALTTSGRSPNVIAGLRKARAKGLLTIGLTGEGGAAVAALADYLLDVPSTSTARIQEAHLFILHELAARLEAAVVRDGEGEGRTGRVSAT
jgi:D-sedoheptulose 7-phosphate isomerase